MNDTKEYIDLLVQAPLAVILMFFVYKVLKMYGDFTKDITKILKNKD